MADQTTITVSIDVKSRLAQAKGDRSWDEFLGEVADDYIDDAIALAEQRLEELRSLKTAGLSLDQVDALRAARKGGEKNDVQKGKATRKVGAPGASRGGGRAGRP